MKAIRYHRHGGPGVLEFDQTRRPDPGGGEVLIDVRAASVNWLDVRFREGGGRYRPSELPATPGVDFAGVVEAVGDDVDGLGVGDRVFGDGIDAFTGYPGSYAEAAVAPADRVAELQRSVEFVEGAAVAHAGLTAWQAIVGSDQPAPGDTCLVHGGAGGVGHLAVQLAKTVGANVISTAGSADARRRVTALGADVVLDYSSGDLGAAILDACDDLGRPDLVVDHRLHEYLELDVDVAARGASVIGLAGQRVTFDNTSTAVGKHVSLDFVTPAKLPDRRVALEKLGALLEDGTIEVDVDDRFPLAEAAAAHRALERGGFVGKLVLEPQ